jgi:putative flippase GtrA
MGPHHQGQTIGRPAGLLVETGRIVRFGIVGVCATFVYIGCSIAAVKLLPSSVVLASIFGQCMSTAISYVGHSKYSFQVETDHGTFLWRFSIISAITFLMNGAATWMLAVVIGLSHTLSFLIVTVLIPVTNYVCNRFWVFLPGRGKRSR